EYPEQRPQCDPGVPVCGTLRRYLPATIRRKAGPRPRLLVGERLRSCSRRRTASMRSMNSKRARRSAFRHHRIQRPFEPQTATRSAASVPPRLARIVAWPTLTGVTTPYETDATPESVDSQIGLLVTSKSSGEQGLEETQ